MSNASGRADQGVDVGHDPFAGKQIVVTGGGTGIGRATALAFARLGATRVIVTGRRREPLANTATMHRAVTPVVADVTTEAGAQAVAEVVREAGGYLDVLVHNAGIVRATPLGALELEACQELLQVNVLGPVLLTARLLPFLRAPGGNIVLVSSVLGHLPTAAASVYAASKAAVDSLTRSWAKELAPRGIRVNAVAPGTVRTDVLEAAGFDAEVVRRIRAQHDATVPLGRIGEVEDIAPWIVRLAEPVSSWITGKVITVDGGWDLL